MGAGAIPIQIEKVIKERAGSKHKLQVYIGHSSYSGDDRIDVSFHGGHHIMVPPRQILFDYKMGRTTRNELQEEFFKFLENSYIQYNHTWNAILDSDRIVMVCSCNTYDETCQRYFIVQFLKKFGAVFKGETAS